MFKQIFGRFPYLLFRKTKNGKIIREIDGLRFLAILPVVLQHLSERLIRNFPGTFSQPINENPWAFAVSRGSVGVLLFFAISGFVLSLPFIKVAEKRRSWSYRKYFYRRITRIEPPYLIWMTVFFIVLFLREQFAVPELFHHYMASIFYLHNIVYDDFSIINPVAWSLEIEIQFYLIAPFLVLLLYKIPHHLTRQGVTFFSILSYISLQHYMGWQYAPYKFSLLGQFQHFLAGILLADIFVHNAKKWNKAFYWDLLGVASFITMMYTWTEEYIKSIFFLIALCLLIIAAFRGKLMSRFFRLPWIVAFGGMCYTIYLIHLPLLEFIILFTKYLHVTDTYLINLLIQVIVVLPIVAIASIIGYLLLEKPFMDKAWPSKFIHYVKRFSFNIGRKVVHSPRKLFVGLLLSSTCLQLLHAQSFEGPRSEWPDQKLAPVEVLVDRAIEKAHQLKRTELDIESKRYEIKQEQRSFLNYIKMGAGVSYGNGNIVTSNGTGIDQSFALQNRQSLNYNAGVSVGLSLGDLFNRKAKLRIKEIEVDKLYLEKDETKDLIRQEVIDRYQKVLLSIRVFEAMLESSETGTLTFTVADKYFKEGQMPIEAYSQALESKANRELALEKARLECVIALFELKEVVGQDIY